MRTTDPLTDALVKLASFIGSATAPASIPPYAAELARELFAARAALVMLWLHGDAPTVAGHAGDDLGSTTPLIGVCVDVIETGEVHTGASALGVPLRHGEAVIGALALSGDASESMAVLDAQRFADVVATTLLREQRLHDATALAAQLQHALDARVVIEQAKGLVAGTLRSTLDDALDRMRQYARSRQRRLFDVATAILDGALAVADLDRSDGAEMPSVLLGPATVARRLGISVVEVLRLTESGALPYEGRDGHQLIPEQAVAAYERGSSRRCRP